MDNRNDAEMYVKTTLINSYIFEYYTKKKRKTNAFLNAIYTSEFNCFFSINRINNNLEIKKTPVVYNINPLFIAFITYYRTKCLEVFSISVT